MISDDQVREDIHQSARVLRLATLVVVALLLGAAALYGIHEVAASLNSQRDATNALTGGY